MEGHGSHVTPTNPTHRRSKHGLLLLAPPWLFTRPDSDHLCQKESDLLLPTPVNYKQEVEDEEETQQPESELSDPLTKLSSEDAWKGIASAPRPLVPPSDEVSSVALL